MDEGFRPEDFETQTAEGLVARYASHFLNDLEGDSAEGWEPQALLFAVLQRNPDGERFVRWRSYPDDGGPTAAQMAQLVRGFAVGKIEQEQDPEDRARAAVREIRDRRRARLIGMRRSPGRRSGASHV